jgi:hypothetical protein
VAATLRPAVRVALVSTGELPSATVDPTTGRVTGVKVAEEDVTHESEDRELSVKFTTEETPSQRS